MANRTTTTAQMLTPLVPPVWAPVPSSGCSSPTPHHSFRQLLFDSAGLASPIYRSVSHSRWEAFQSKNHPSFFSWPSMCVQSLSRVNVEEAQPTDGQALLSEGSGSVNTSEV